MQAAAIASLQDHRSHTSRQRYGESSGAGGSASQAPKKV